MQERRNKRLFNSLIGLIILTGFAFWQTVKEDGPEIDRGIFRVEDFKAVDKVLLEYHNRKVELSFNGTRWRVNQRYDADRNMISVLFATLQEAEPKRPIATALRDSVGSQLETGGIKVSFFIGQSLVKEFFAGGNAPKTQAYFHDPQTREVYVMAIPGYRVYVSGIFELEENGWRDKYVFSFNWRNFQSLEVTFPEKPAENFTVAAARNFFGIVGFEADTAKLNTFLDQVSLLRVNQYADRRQITDSLLLAKPLMVITVTDIAKRNYTLKLFKPSAAAVPGLIQDDQGAFFQLHSVQPIIRPKSFFGKR